MKIKDYEMMIFGLSNLPNIMQTKLALVQGFKLDSMYFFSSSFPMLYDTTLCVYIYE